MTVEQGVGVQKEVAGIVYPEKNMSLAAQVRYRRKLVINGVGLLGVGASVAAIVAGFYFSEPQVALVGAGGAFGSMVTTAVGEAVNDWLPPKG